MTVKNMFNVDDDDEPTKEQKPKKRPLPLLNDSEFNTFKVTSSTTEEEYDPLEAASDEIKSRDEEQRKRIENADRLLANKEVNNTLNYLKIYDDSRRRRKHRRCQIMTITIP